MNGDDTPPEEPSEVSRSNEHEYLNRLREFAARRYALVVVVLIALVIASGYLTVATHAAPDTRTEQETVAAWTETGEFNHSALVREGAGAFESGTELTNRTTYFTRVSPELDVEYAYSHDANGELGVRTELLLQIRSSDDEEVYWETTEPLDSASTDSLSADERQTVRATINVSELNQRIETIEEDLGASPGDTEVRIVARSEVQGTAGGESVDRVHEDTLVVIPGGDTYRVEQVQDGAAVHETVRTTTRSVEYGPFRSIGAPLLFLGASAALVTVWWTRRENRLSPIERPEHREYRRQREQFDEWITKAVLPDEFGDRATVEVESLEGLVDVAIDCDRRVIEDARDGGYYVTSDGVVYAYRPPARETRSGSSDESGESGAGHERSEPDTETVVSAEDPDDELSIGAAPDENDATDQRAQSED